MANQETTTLTAEAVARFEARFRAEEFFAFAEAFRRGYRGDSVAFGEGREPFGQRNQRAGNRGYSAGLTANRMTGWTSMSMFA